MKGLPSWRTGTLLDSSLAVMAAASFVAHMTGPAEAEGVTEAAEHASAILPPLVGPLAALGLLGIIRLARRRSLGPIWFLLLPPLAFALQEIAERALDSRMIEPTIFATALVQVPFALVAYALARLLRAAVIRVVRFLRAPRGLPRIRVTSTWRPGQTLALALVPADGGVHRGRAPPHLR
jgi:hypothetical protein